MINRNRYKRLMGMSPEVQFWEKRHIVWQAGGYHQNDVEGYLETLEWAIKKHREFDEEEKKNGNRRSNESL